MRGLLGKLLTTLAVLTAVWLMYGHPSTAATHKPASVTVHHPAGKQAKR